MCKQFGTYNSAYQHVNDPVTFSDPNLHHCIFGRLATYIRFKNVNFADHVGTSSGGFATIP